MISLKILENIKEKKTYRRNEGKIRISIRKNRYDD